MKRFSYLIDPLKYIVDCKPLLALCLGEALFMSGYSLIVPILVLFMNSLGASAVIIGLMFTLYKASSSISPYISGTISDRIGHTNAIIGSTFCYSVSMLIIALAPNFWYIAIAQVIAGFFFITYTVSADALASKLASKEVLGGVMGARWSIAGVGGAAAPLVGGYLATRIGFRFVYGVCFALILFTAFYFFVALSREEKVQSPTSSRQWNWKALFVGGIVLYLAFILFIDNIGTGIFELALPLFSSENIGLSPAALGSAWSAFILMMTVSAFFMGSLSDKVGRKPLIVFGTVSWVIIGFLILHATSALHVIILLGFGGVMTATISPSLEALVADITTESERGRAYGIVGSLSSLGYMGGAFLGGVLLDQLSYYPTFMVMLGFWIVTVLMLLTIIGVRREE
jgi:MFS family permease